MTTIYEPSRTISSRISRRLTRYVSRRMAKVKLDRPIVSVTFDDCPLSAIDNGVKLLEKEGWHSTIYVSGGLMGTTNHHGLHIKISDCLELEKTGHEIAGHTYSHIDAQQYSLSHYLKDMDRNRRLFEGAGLKPFETFAYPYGQTTPGLKSALSKKFLGLRGIEPGAHADQVDLNQVKSFPAFSGATLEAAVSKIKALEKDPAWITIFTHDIRDNHSPWGCSPNDMKRLVQAIKESGAEVMTVAGAIKKLGAA